MSNSTSSGGGVGFGGLLLIVFIVLKLTEAIDWSWWWVMSPLWIPFALAGVILALWGGYELFKNLLNRR